MSFIIKWSMSFDKCLRLFRVFVPCKRYHMSIIFTNEFEDAYIVMTILFRSWRNHFLTSSKIELRP